MKMIGTAISALSGKGKLIAGVMGILAILGAAIYIYGKIYDIGYNAAEIKYQKEIVAGNKRINELTNKITTMTMEHATELEKSINELVIEYEEKLDAIKATSTSDIIANANANGGLSIDVDREEHYCSNEQDENDPQGTTPVNNGTTRARLSNQASEFLINEAKRADKIVLQLDACQKLVMEYITAVDDYNSKLDKID